ncbi:MAG TPA: chemotaxis protein CheB [Balneolaceae bacterium]|nr:chemotaxis protein CheB [Balneolaceae bacterium]
MNKIDVIIVDRNVLVRQAICHVLRNESEFRVIGMGGNIEQAVNQIKNAVPDVVLVDIEHPDLDIPSFIKKMERDVPETSIVVLGTRNEHGAQKVITALRLGAVDFVTKPRQGTHLLFAGRHLSKRLITITRIATRINHATTKSELSWNPAPNNQSRFEEIIPEFCKKETNNFAHSIVLGGCTGSIPALFSIISRLPPDLTVPVSVVIHLPKHYTKVLAQELDSQSRINVKEVYDNVELKPGTVWIAAGGYHTEMVRNGHLIRLHKNHGTREAGNRPGINVLFRSAAKVYGSRALGIILSGHGIDGIDGSRAIKMAGGEVLVQDPENALVPELPLNILRAGIANNYYTVKEISEQIIKRIPANPIDYNQGKINV